MKKRMALILTLGTALAGFAFLANRLDLFHDEQEDYVKFDTSNR